MHKYTKEVKSRNERSIINYVLINKRNRTDVKDDRIRRGVEIYSEYYLTPDRVIQDKGYIQNEITNQKTCSCSCLF